MESYLPDKRVQHFLCTFTYHNWPDLSMAAKRCGKEWKDDIKEYHSLEERERHVRSEVSHCLPILPPVWSRCSGSAAFPPRRIVPPSASKMITIMLMMIIMMMLIMMILLLLLMMMICLGLAALQWSHEASKSTTGENESTGDQDGVFPVQSCDQPERDQYKCGRNIRILFHLVLIHYLCIELIVCWHTHTLMWVMRQVLFKTMFLCPLEILQIHLE